MPAATQDGRIYPPDMARTRRYTVVFAVGGTAGRWRRFSRFCTRGRSFRNKHRLNSRKSICTGKPWIKKAIRAARGSFCIGTTRGGKTTKIHMFVNRLGIPIELAITAGNVQDCSEAIPLVEQSPLKAGSNLLGDRIYGSMEFRNYLTGREMLYTIPPKKNIKNP